MTATLFIVRHGDTFAPGELPRRIGARSDLPLVASGRAQSEALARRFADRGTAFGRILVAPSRRATETAALIAHGQPLEAVDWLAEIDHGPDEGQPETQVRERLGEAALAAWDREGMPPPGWRVDAPERLAGWRALFDEVRGHGDTLAVTSAGSARFALLADAQLLVAARALPSLKLRTGAYGRIGLSPVDPPQLLGWDERP